MGPPTTPIASTPSPRKPAQVPIDASARAATPVEASTHSPREPAQIFIDTSAELDPPSEARQLVESELLYDALMAEAAEGAVPPWEAQGFADEERPEVSDQIAEELLRAASPTESERAVAIDAAAATVAAAAAQVDTPNFLETVSRIATHDFDEPFARRRPSQIPEIDLETP